MNKVIMAQVLLAFSVTAALAGCGSNNDNGTSTVTTTTTVATTGVTGPYETTILGDSPTFYWLLNELSGSSFADQVNGNTGFQGPLGGSPQTAIDLGISSPINNDANTGLLLISGLIYTQGPNASGPITAPTSFSEEFWFQTTQGGSVGGRIFGFGTNPLSNNTSVTTADRHVYMDGFGNLYFGVTDNQGNPFAIDTHLVGYGYDDNVWHYVVATYNDATLTLDLYVDGNLIQTGTAANNIGNYFGYWRIGYDSIASGYRNSPGTQNFNGSLAQVAVYNSVLSQTQISNHYTQAGH